MMFSVVKKRKKITRDPLLLNGGIMLEERETNPVKAPSDNSETEPYTPPPNPEPISHEYAAQITELYGPKIHPERGQYILSLIFDFLIDSRLYIDVIDAGKDECNGRYFADCVTGAYRHLQFVLKVGEVQYAIQSERTKSTSTNWWLIRLPNSELPTRCNLYTVRCGSTCPRVPLEKGWISVRGRNPSPSLTLSPATERLVEVNEDKYSEILDSYGSAAED